MSLVHAVQEYITRMIESVSGMKVLILDDETIGIVSLAFSQTQLLQKEVYLFERLDSASRETMTHLKALVFVRPTPENCRLLDAELRAPKYGEYHLFFSNVVPSAFLEELAESDEFEAVHQVHEYFADFYALNRHLFSLQRPGFVTSRGSAHASLLRRLVDGVTAVCLALKKHPTVRCVSNSRGGEQLAKAIGERIGSERALFEFRQSDTPPLVLILDRKNDPVTPLLHQWTYEAMIHEMIGIKNNRVLLAPSDAPEAGGSGAKPKVDEVVLSAEHDAFFSENMHVNFAQLGANMKKLVEDYARKYSSHSSIESLSDIKSFVEQYPEFRKLQEGVSKHVALTQQLSRVIHARKVFQVSGLQQDLACKQEASDARKKVRDALSDGEFALEDKRTLLALYCLRYESSLTPQQWSEFEAACPALDVSAVRAVLRYAGGAQRSGDIFENKTFMKMATSSIRGLRGVDNVFTQHVPPLKAVLEAAVGGRLDEKTYPVMYGSRGAKVADVIVVYVGGVTYEESLCVHEMRTQAKGEHKVFLGGDVVHNSRSFLEMCKEYAEMQQDSYKN